MDQLNYIVVDIWNQKGHNKRCVDSPKNVLRLWRHFPRVNTEIAEQTFPWFRGCARLFNGMKKSRHHFAVLLFARKHNTLLDTGLDSHLNAFAAKCNVKAKKTKTCIRKK